MFQKIVLSAVLFLSLLVASFFLIIKVIDFNEYKPKIQRTIKEKTGYEIVIRGDISLSLSPLGISILDVEVFNPHYKDKTPFAKLGSFDIALEIIPLFSKQIKVKHIAFENLILSVEKVKQGKFNFDIPTGKTGVEKNKNDNNTTKGKVDELPFVDVANVKFANATINYVDLVTKSKINLEKVNLTLSDIHYDTAKNNLKSLFFKANTTVSQIKFNKYIVKDFATNLEMKDAVVSAENLKYTLFDSPLQGSGKVDLNGKLPKVSIKHKIADLKLANISKEVFGQEFLDGKANGDLKLSFSLGDDALIKSTLGGFFQLYAENVNVKGYDIDKILGAFDISKKEMNLTNLLSGSFEGTKGESSILKQLNTKLEIGYSEVQLTDVALSTNKNRVALKGALNIVEEKILGVKIGLLDAGGCSVFDQTIVGTFSKPTVKVDEKVIKALVSLLDKSKQIPQNEKLPPENCTPFYEGVVKHP